MPHLVAIFFLKWGHLLWVERASHKSRTEADWTRAELSAGRLLQRRVEKKKKTERKRRRERKERIGTTISDGWQRRKRQGQPEQSDDSRWSYFPQRSTWLDALLWLVVRVHALLCVHTLLRRPRPITNWPHVPLKPCRGRRLPGWHQEKSIWPRGKRDWRGAIGRRARLSTWQGQYLDAALRVCVCLRCGGANDEEADVGQRTTTVPSLSNHRSVELGCVIFPQCSRVFKLNPGYW